MENRDLMNNVFVKFSIIIFLSVFVVVFMEKGKKRQCTEVRAYIPVKGKWIEKDICLEGKK
jgi:hypothetical protein